MEVIEISNIEFGHTCDMGRVGTAPRHNVLPGIKEHGTDTIELAAS